ncbi:NADH:ubiquinone reductase (Na(+)-transporting) subunit C [Pseudomonadota bacterium]
MTDGVKSIVVAGTVAFVCALVVSTSAVVLKPYQQANLEAERQARIQAIVAGVPGLSDLLGVNARLRDEVVEVSTGHVGMIFKDTTSPLDPADDLAGLKEREDFQTVYVAEDTNARVQLIILPVRGLGYASIMKGFIALSGDGQTIQGLAITEHGETPGLGARVDDPEWLIQWSGKSVYDASGQVAIDLVKGGASGPHQVDAISGATRTSNGVENMLRFWLGPLGYGPYLIRIREGAREGDMR